MNKFHVGQTVWVVMIGEVERIENVGLKEKPKLQYKVVGKGDMAYVMEDCLTGEQTEPKLVLAEPKLIP